MTAGPRDNAIAAALRGENPKVMARMRSGFAVIGDTQHLPGYSLLLTDDLAVDHPTDLPWPRRRDFFFDLTLVGEAVFAVTREQGAHRINYEVLGNSWPHLHGHVHARYTWEPAERISGPVWRYPRDVRNAPEHAYEEARHGELRAAIAAELERLMREAYAALD
ncbi:MAG: HIT family hydrolase [Actinomycetota bacterium]|nr:HIT family hydrolase [Actinomycetota bacterium]